MTKRTLLLAVALGASMVLLNIVIREQETPEARAQKEVRATNQFLADECVRLTKAGLHDPDSAKLPDAMSPFDYPANFYVGGRKKGVITVQFDMRAKNGFNATRAFTVNCDFKSAKGGYHIVNHKSWQQ